MATSATGPSNPNPGLPLSITLDPEAHKYLLGFVKGNADTLTKAYESASTKVRSTAEKIEQKSQQLAQKRTHHQTESAKLAAANAKIKSLNAELTKYKKQKKEAAEKVKDDAEEISDTEKELSLLQTTYLAAQKAEQAAQVSLRVPQQLLKELTQSSAPTPTRQATSPIKEVEGAPSTVKEPVQSRPALPASRIPKWDVTPSSEKPAENH